MSKTKDLPHLRAKDIELKAEEEIKIEQRLAMRN